MRSTIHYIMPGGEDRRRHIPGAQPEPDYSSLLPDYEAACAQAMKQTPPPSYQVAMANVITVQANPTSPVSASATAVVDMPVAAAAGPAVGNVVPDVETPVIIPVTAGVTVASVTPTQEVNATALPRN